MAMTNSMIVFMTQMTLVAEGKLGTTGRKIIYEDSNGETHEADEPEEIHTFNGWKERGFQVRKSEHSQIQFPIWKYSGKAIETEEGSEEIKGHCFMKNSFWFTRNQVEPIPHPMRAGR